jgi:Lar family restriction alleviation protein
MSVAPVITEGLEPCPFCGGEGFVVPEPGTRDLPPLFRPQCKRCGAGHGGFVSRVQAVKAWNRRADSLTAEAFTANAKGAALSSVLLAALKAVHAPYANLTDEALEAGVLMEWGPPKPEKGAALLKVRAAIDLVEGR